MMMSRPTWLVPRLRERERERARDCLTDRRIEDEKERDEETGGV